MSMIIEVQITKPKRQENGTYQADILHKGSKENNPVTLKMKQAYIFAIKEMKRDKHDDTNQEPSFSLFFKHSSIADTLCDINQQVVDIVKQNCSTWFRTSLSDDMIDDYFVNNIMYDKKKGKYVKIKCVNDISQVPVNVMVNLEVSLQHIRFYKQQFVLEWVIEEVEILNDVVQDKDEEDIPYPNNADLRDIQHRTLQKANALLHCVQSIMKKMDEYKSSIDLIMTNAKASTDINSLVSYCDDLDVLQDEISKHEQ